MGLLERVVALWRRDHPGEALAALPSPQGMGRRQFLRLMASSAAVAATVDVERLLWVPGETVAIPAMPMPGFLTAEWVSVEAMRIMEQNLRAARELNRFFSEDAERALSVSAVATVPRRGRRFTEIPRADVHDQLTRELSRQFTERTQANWPGDNLVDVGLVVGDDVSRQRVVVAHTIIRNNHQGGFDVHVRVKDRDA